MEEKTGVMSEIIFRNEENGYTVAVMETEEEVFTVVGNLPICNKGSYFRLLGEFVEHHQYGEQFSFSEFEEKIPRGGKAIFDFLSSGVIKGIGPSTARAIVNKFGDDTLTIMENSPIKLKEVSGIGEKTAVKIANSFNLHMEFARVSLELQKYGITAKQAVRLYKAYGKNTPAILEENPYRLIEEVQGIGFKKADEIAGKIGFSTDSQFRIKSGIKYTLEWFSGDGNTYLPRRELVERAGELLDIPQEIVDENIVYLALDGDIKVDVLEDMEVCYLIPFYRAERSVAFHLELLSEAGLKPLTTDIDNMIRQAERDTGIPLSEKQKAAVKSSISNAISVITGGPGTGKTTIIEAIMRILDRSGFKTAIAAPTGRAAKRISETSGRFSQTIHRLLEYYYDETADKMRFNKNKDNPLEYDVVVVDEMSMVDILLMQALMEALKPGTRLIMIGDVDQLPPVGAGNVLRDLIDSEYVNVTMLTEIFRQAEESMIVVNAHRINNGEYPEYNVKDSDFFLMERDSDKSIQDLLVELVTDRLPQYYASQNAISDIQVLTPTRKGVLGTVILNQILQAALNPPEIHKAEKRFGESLFREGDKVMQIKNNYGIGWRRIRDFSEGEGVFNGDIGFITRIDNENGTVHVVFDGDRIVEYDNSFLDELELAYALTVHKSQGSEFSIVVMPAFQVSKLLATRNLLYTAVTRGKDAVILCGQERFIRGMVDNNSIKNRYSGLKYRLKRLFDK